MSGVALDWTLAGEREAVAALGVLYTASRHQRPAMDEIGRMLVDHTRLRFERGKAPDGAEWIPSLRALREGGKTLIDSRQLDQSLTHNAADDHVEVGSAKVYAAIHQLGGDAGRGHKVHLPARPYLGIDGDDADDIREIAVRHLARGLP
jgi:phage virion morphogenesis protein